MLPTERAIRWCLPYLLATVIGCAAVPSENPLLGRWFGETSVPGGDGIQKWLIERRADGTFTVTFRAYREGAAYRTQRERGRWAYSNGLYTTWTQFMGNTATDPTDRHFQDVYVVEGLRNGELAYRHIATDRRFRVIRVTDDFQLP